MNPKTTKENQTNSEEEPNNVNKILYSIKKATKDKTEDDIIKMIKTEIDLSKMIFRFGIEWLIQFHVWYWVSVSF